MSEQARPRLWLAFLGGLLLAAAMPGVVPVVGPLLVLPGLMAWFAVATGSSRPVRDSYVFGCTFMTVFSWSVVHVMVAALAGIIVVGGLYFVLGTIAVRSARRLRLVAFAVAAAGTFWLRAYMPEIYYPHGQPVHALFEWPLLLGSVSLGGEPLGNALLAALAAAAVEMWRSWRVAQPPLAVARTQLLAVAALGVASTVAGHWLRPAPEVEATVDIAAIEPGLHPFDPYVGLEPPAAKALYLQILETRLVAPTRQLLAAQDPPDLVLWPETSLPLEFVPAEEIAAGRARIALPGGLPASATRLVVGALIDGGGVGTPAALLLELPNGRILGHNEKHRLVPGGEFLPFVGVLPQSVADAVLGAFEAAMGAVPGFAAGVPQPLLETAAGHRFGALLCYDNAFPEQARDLVAAGARFLVVLSNEAWYRGGAELAQLVAMTVCRALEQGVPIVRCTTDGWSVVVGPDGRILDQLPPAAAPTPAARILRAKLQVGAGAENPMASWRGLFGPFAAVLLALSILHGAVRWARLRVARQAS